MAEKALRQITSGLPLNSASVELQDLIRNTTDLIQMMDLEGRFLYVNRAWKDAIGYRSGQLAQMNSREVIHPDFLQETLDRFERVRRGETIPDFETVYRRADGRRVYLTGSVNCRFDGAGRPIAYRCIFHDTTARKRAEKAQYLYAQIASSTLTTRSLNDLYHFIHRELGQVIDTKNFFIALYDPDKRYLTFPYYVDEYFQGNLRFTRRKIGNGLTEYAIAANSPLMLTETDMLALERRRQLYLYGQVPKVILSVPLRIGDRITGVIGVKSYERTNKYDIRDLELLEFLSGQVAVAIERKQAEAELARQTGRLHAIFESSSHLMWTVNRRLKLTSFNDNYARLMQQEQQRLLQVNVSSGQFAWQLMNTSNRKLLDRHFKLAFRGQPTSFELHLERLFQGGEAWFEINLTPIAQPDGRVEEVAGIARNITALRKTTQELVKARDEAERSLKVKERFLANMSHEIRTPMNGIIGMIDLLSDTPLQDEQLEYVQTVKRSSETLLTILNDILDLSKIEAGKMALHESPFVFQQLFDKLTGLFGQTARNRGIRLSYQFLDDDLPRYVIADETRLLQILSNLTSNALKFTEHGAVTLRVSNLGVHGKWHRIRMEVSDTGIGISPEGLTQLFGAFQQLDSTTRKSFGGTGLGLTISRELARLMQGDIGVQSEQGKGSTFWVEIPVKETRIAPLAGRPQSAPFQIEGALAASEPRILLVDDNAVNRKVAGEILKKAGVEVHMADSGRRALQTVEESFLENKPFDLIIMDIQMPDLDGLETTALLRQQYPDRLPPVLAMTAYSMKEDRERFLSQGMDDYISKPIRAEGLILKIQDWLQRIGKTATPARPAARQASSPADRLDQLFDLNVVSQLRELAGNEMVEQVFEEFLQEATEQIAGAKAAFAEKDYNRVESYLHTLKGNAGTLGITQLHEAIKCLEVKTKIGNFNSFEAEMPVIEAEFERFTHRYRELWPTEPGQGP